MRHLNYYPQRKTNLNTWTCPKCGRVTNSSGAPGHLRNKHGIPWRHLYLKHSMEIIYDEEKAKLNELTQPERYLFCGLDYRFNEGAKNAINSFTRIAPIIRKAVVKNDTIALGKIELILKNALREIDHFNAIRDYTGTG